MSDDWSGRDRALRGAEGERRSSQAKGSGDDDTPKSAAQPHAEGATRRKRWGISQVMDGGTKPRGRVSQTVKIPAKPKVSEGRKV